MTYLRLHACHAAFSLIDGDRERLLKLGWRCIPGLPLVLFFLAEIKDLGFFSVVTELFSCLFSVSLATIKHALTDTG